jgi:hypothetical protein
LQELDRPYDPSEPPPGEEWIVAMFEPIRYTHHQLTSHTNRYQICTPDTRWRLDCLCAEVLGILVV